jgi:1-phosphatidylinositol-3-phosphate 5-kinase
MFCTDFTNTDNTGVKKYCDKIHPSESPRQSPEPPSPTLPHTPTRSDEDDGEDSSKQFFSSYCTNNSDIDTSSVSDRHEFYNYKSFESSPSDSPSKAAQSVQKQTASVFKDISIHDYKLLDFEKDGLIWCPPPPVVQENKGESDFFAYDDEDDEIGDSSAIFSSTNSFDFGKGENEEREKEPVREAVQGHFRALVSQLLQGECIEGENWLDIITEIAWQAANFVKPDTSQGGSMDPGDYVQIKCVASGLPSESKLVKGVVCTKNIKHKRMTSQYKNPRLLLLAGSLEYQRVTNQLSSFDTLLQQEIDQLKMIVSKIESHSPNVLLVEKTVSSYAQEFLLAKEISLVLNVKKPLLQRIARCTGAPIIPSIDKISTTQPGHCELFRLERFNEEHEPSNQFNKKPTKTLMFFEGCPRRLGCTVLLKGSSREELKKVKQVVQYAVFAAYHLSLETSFLADEGASLPTFKPALAIPDRISVDNFEPEESGNINIPSDSNDDDVASPNETKNDEHEELNEFERTDEASSEYYSAADNQQSILVSFSSRCILNGTICERSRLLRIKFYGCFDKPLGRYLRDDLFDQAYSCGTCNEAADAHVRCYTHQQGNLTINVRRMPSVKLSGERDGKIWMWHRCLRCTHINGVPPATKRVIMSNAACGLSFGKFLELSFSNHATANRVASCGHSLQRDCLRYYGFGSMVAFFRYSPIDILSVRLPLSTLELNGEFQQDWLKNEAAELCSKKDSLYEEISSLLNNIEQKSTSFGHQPSDANDLSDHINELKDLLIKERNDYHDMLVPGAEEFSSEFGQPSPLDIIELNHLRHTLLIGSRVWDRRLYSLNSLLQTQSSSPKLSSSYSDNGGEENYQDFAKLLLTGHCKDHIEEENTHSGTEIALVNTSLERLPSAASNLSEQIDSIWAGTDQSNEQLLHKLVTDATEAGSLKQIDQIQNQIPPLNRVLSPTRVNSFDSAVRTQERISKGLPPSKLHLTTLRSFHASGDYRNMVRDPVANMMQRTYSQISPHEAQKRNLLLCTAPSLISAAPVLPEGARLLVGPNNVVVLVYDNEPTSIISYALSCKEHEDMVGDLPSGSPNKSRKSSNMTGWQSFGSLDLDYMHYASFTSQDSSISMGGLFADSKITPHLKVSFEDDSSSNGGGGKVKFMVTCYFAKEFDSLRRKCCPGKVDFIRSLSRCKKWSAQGGKSNVYFAKSLDERFIVKQVTKTELVSFEEFAPEYFKYLTDSLNSGSPTCLAKILGIYQVSVKHLKGGKETKMDLMVMENLFYKRNISRVYDLKGSARSRYNSDTSGVNKVLLDTNLLEALRSNPIFLGSKAKRSLERAVWNDTSFLAGVDVMDYSLLVGVDEESSELVIGIIDFMRQYTWDKHLETWVKASGILGGPKNASPTIISPKQYKRRFRKAMTTYFLTVPDQWSP